MKTESPKLHYIPNTELMVNATEIDHAKYPVIDIHCHLGSLVLGRNYEELYDIDEFVEEVKAYGIRHIVNLDGGWGSELDKMLKHTNKHNDFISTFSWVDLSDIDKTDFEKKVRKQIAELKKKGIKGLKFWKNISLELKIPIDDIRLKVIWETAKEFHLPVLIHIADPIAFFKPIDIYNERYDELIKRPEWSFYGAEFFDFWELMEMQDNLLSNNPDTTFVVAHFGSCSEDLGYVAISLDKYPNMYIDFAERIQELGRQPYTAKAFFEKYQDRILFGTDMNPLNIDYKANFRFLETKDEYFDYTCHSEPTHGNWKIYGIYLEDEILKKVYYKNAEKILKI